MPRLPAFTYIAVPAILLALACGTDAVKSPELTPTAPQSAEATTVGTPETSPTAPPTPPPTPEANLHVSDRPIPQPGLWVGTPDAKGPFPIPPWVAVRIIPGQDPDSDDWSIETGPVPGIFPPALSCTPKPVDDGWSLSPCVGSVNVEIEVRYPSDANGEATLTIELPGLTATATSQLRRVPVRTEPPASDNVEVLWHQPGNNLHTDIWAQGELAFAPRLDGVVEVIDAGSGEILGEAVTPGQALDVKSALGVLHVATGEHGMWTFDISDPTSPIHIATFLSPIDDSDAVWRRDHFHNIALSPDGQTVYVIDNSSTSGTDLVIVDVSDPAEPTPVGGYRFEGGLGRNDFANAQHDVQVIERDGRLIAFLNHLAAGLFILDVTDPQEVTVLGTVEWEDVFSHSGWPFWIEDRLYYAHTGEGVDRHLTVLDVTDPSAGEVVSHFETRDGISIHNVQVVDGIAYISYYIDGLRIVDLRDPHSPTEIGHFDTVPEDAERGVLQGAWGVRVLDGTVYLSDIETGTYALKVNLN